MKSQHTAPFKLGRARQADVGTWSLTQIDEGGNCEKFSWTGQPVLRVRVLGRITPSYLAIVSRKTDERIQRSLAWTQALSAGKGESTRIFTNSLLQEQVSDRHAYADIGLSTAARDLSAGSGVWASREKRYTFLPRQRTISRITPNDHRGLRPPFTEYLK